MSKREGMGSTDLGYVAIGRAAARPLSEQEIQAGIARSMREVVARPYNPQALRAPDEVKVANAPVVTTAGRGWQADAPLEPVVKPGSLEERVMSNLIDQALPPGVERKDRK